MAKSTPPAKKKEHPSQDKLNIASTVVLAIIVVTFIAAPTLTGFLSATSVSFGSYAGRSIDHTADNSFGREVRELARYVPDQTPAEAVWRQAFQNAAFRVALQVEAEEAGVIVSSPLVDNALRQFGPYLDQDGQFSPQLYRQTPEAEKARYRQEVYESLLQSEWLQMRITGPRIPDYVMQALESMAYPQVKLEYVSFTEDDFPNEQAEQWGRQNSGLFRTMVLSRITITTSKQEAEQVRAEAESGTRAFESLAETYSKDSYAAQGGSMGRVAFHELRTDFNQLEDLETLFTLSAGSLSPVFSVPAGWAFYRVQEAAREPDWSNPDTVKAARRYLQLNERGLVEDYLLRRAAEFRESALQRGWQAAARQFGKTSAETNFLALNFGNHPSLPSLPTSGDLGGLSASEEFFRRVFRLQPQQIGEPLALARRILVFRLLEIRREPPPTEERTGVEWAEQQRRFLANQRIAQYRNLLLGSYKFRDNFQEGFQQRLRTFLE